MLRAVKNLFELFSLFLLISTGGILSGLALLLAISYAFSHSSADPSSYNGAITFVFLPLIFFSLSAVLGILALAFLVWWVGSLIRKTDLYFLRRFRWLLLLVYLFWLVILGYQGYKTVVTKMKIAQTSSQGSLQSCEELSFAQILECKNKVLLKELNISSCEAVFDSNEKVPEGYLKQEECFNRLIARKGDASLCTFTVLGQRCVTEIAARNGDASICQKILIKEGRPACEQVVQAVSTKNKALCPTSELMSRVCLKFF